MEDQPEPAPDLRTLELMVADLIRSDQELRSQPLLEQLDELSGAVYRQEEQRG